MLFVVAAWLEGRVIELRFGVSLLGVGAVVLLATRRTSRRLALPSPPSPPPRLNGPPGLPPLPPRLNGPPGLPPPSPGVSPLPPLDDYAALDRQTDCNPVEQPGAIALRQRVLEQIGGYDAGIVRGCDVGGTSEHKEGRAWDWGCSPAQAARLFAWLLAPDALGRPHANARRAGIMYLIYNRRIWRAYRERAWMAYSGSSPHTDHVHLSLSRAGGAGLTSLYASPSMSAFHRT